MFNILSFLLQNNIMYHKIHGMYMWHVPFSKRKITHKIPSYPLMGIRRLFTSLNQFNVTGNPLHCLQLSLVLYT